MVNNTGERVLLRDVGFNGCLWPGVIAYGEATPPSKVLGWLGSRSFQEDRRGEHQFGHSHDADGAWSSGATVFANVTTWECERRPTVLNIDLGLRQVILVDVPPAKR